MRTAIRITGRHIHLLADKVRVSTRDLHNEMLDAKLVSGREQDKQGHMGSSENELELKGKLNDYR